MARHGSPAKRILAISSSVVVGQVGLSVIGPALALSGVEGSTLPTVLLSSRPGLGTTRRHVLEADVLDRMLEALDRDGRMAEFDGVLCGYFAEAAQVTVVARHLDRLRRQRPDTRLLIDPVIGDEAAGLYVDPSVAAAVRDLLLPLASIATPNRFELGWLADRPVRGRDALVRAARSLAAPLTVATSAECGEDWLTTLAIGGDSVESVRSRRLDRVPNGTGDLFAALFLAAVCEGATVASALSRSVAALDRVAAASAGRPWLDLAPLRTPAP